MTTAYIGNYYELSGSAYKKYYYASVQRVALNDNGTLYWLLGDHLGSTAITANSSGGWYAEQRYKPWGETRYTNGTTPTRRQFTGQISDTVIGLYFYNARSYSSYLNRWLSPDTIVPDPANPQSLNRYSYVNNRPLNFIDPSGHFLQCTGDSHEHSCWDDGYSVDNPNPAKVSEDAKARQNALLAYNNVSCCLSTDRKGQQEQTDLEFKPAWRYSTDTFRHLFRDRTESRFDPFANVQA